MLSHAKYFNVFSFHHVCCFDTIITIILNNCGSPVLLWVIKTELWQFYLKKSKDGNGTSAKPFIGSLDNQTILMHQILIIAVDPLDGSFLIIWLLKNAGMVMEHHKTVENGHSFIYITKTCNLSEFGYFHQ